MDPITSSLTMMENLGGGADFGEARGWGGAGWERVLEGRVSHQLQGHCSALALE